MVPIHVEHSGNVPQTHAPTRRRNPCCWRAPSVRIAESRNLPRQGRRSSESERDGSDHPCQGYPIPNLSPYDGRRCPGLYRSIPFTAFPRAPEAPCPTTTCRRNTSPFPPRAGGASRRAAERRRNHSPRREPWDRRRECITSPGRGGQISDSDRDGSDHPSPDSRNPGPGVWKRPVKNRAMRNPPKSFGMRWVMPLLGRLGIHAVGNGDEAGTRSIPAGDCDAPIQPVNDGEALACKQSRSVAWEEATGGRWRRAGSKPAVSDPHGDSVSG